MSISTSNVFTFPASRHLMKRTRMNSNKLDIKKELKALYKHWPNVKRFMAKLGCPSQEAEDIFQEALIIFIRKQEDPSFLLTVEPIHYVRNTCKLLWYNEARKQAKQCTFQLDQEVLSLDDDWFSKESKISIVEKAIQQLGEQCRQLLHLFYGAGLGMQEIAKKIGLRNEKVAKAQKYRCIQKAKENARVFEIETNENCAL